MHAFIPSTHPREKQRLLSTDSPAPVYGNDIVNNMYYYNNSNNKIKSIHFSVPSKRKHLPSQIAAVIRRNSMPCSTPFNSVLPYFRLLQIASFLPRTTSKHRNQTIRTPNNGKKNPCLLLLLLRFMIHNQHVLYQQQISRAITAARTVRLGTILGSGPPRLLVQYHKYKRGSQKWRQNIFTHPPLSILPPTQSFHITNQQPMPLCTRRT